MRKRLLSALLALYMLLGLLPSTVYAASNTHSFIDVNETDWFYDSVQYVYSHGLMSGTSSNMFSPSETITRGMLVTILHRVEGSPAASGHSFSDVAKGAYYFDAVIWASANGIVSGYTSGNFGPNDPLTREQMFAILYRYAQYKGYDTSESGHVVNYSDGIRVSSYAVSAVNWAIGHGLISDGGSGTLAPTDNATRGQAADILTRFCRRVSAYTQTTIPRVLVQDVMGLGATITFYPDMHCVLSISYGEVDLDGDYTTTYRVNWYSEGLHIIYFNLSRPGGRFDMAATDRDSWEFYLMELPGNKWEFNTDYSNDGLGYTPAGATFTPQGLDRVRVNRPIFETSDYSAYRGYWVYYINSVPDLELYINSISNERVSFDLDIYRIAGFENQTANISSDGSAYANITSQYGEGSGRVRISFGRDSISLYFIDATGVLDSYRGQTLTFFNFDPR